jgi:hypothetical protein
MTDDGSYAGKYCIDCRFSRIVTAVQPVTYSCTHPSSLVHVPEFGGPINPVTGKPKGYMMCMDMRVTRDPAKCGKDGKFFQKKDTKQSTVSVSPPARSVKPSRPITTRK